MSSWNENEILHLLQKFLQEKTLSSTDSRKMINAVIRGDLTTWQYLKVKVPPGMQDDLPHVLGGIVDEAHGQTKNDYEFFSYTLGQLKDLYVPMFKKSLGI